MICHNYDNQFAGKSDTVEHSKYPVYNTENHYNFGMVIVTNHSVVIVTNHSVVIVTNHSVV
jgi:hypothetical protein